MIPRRIRETEGLVQSSVGPRRLLTHICAETFGDGWEVVAFPLLRRVLSPSPFRELRGRLVADVTASYGLISSTYELVSPAVDVAAHR